MLFRHSDFIVGEAIAIECDSNTSVSRMLNGKKREYEATITFAPSSVRLFSPPIRIELLQSIIGSSPKIVTARNNYYCIPDLSVHPRLLYEHLKCHGTLI